MGTHYEIFLTLSHQNQNIRGKKNHKQLSCFCQRCRFLQRLTHLEYDAANDTMTCTLINMQETITLKNTSYSFMAAEKKKYFWLANFRVPEQKTMEIVSAINY